MAVELRYVGTRGVNQWSTLNYNERNVIENGFFDEFKMAMANLHGEQCRGRQPRRIVRLLRRRQRHVRAADLPGVPERPGRLGQHRRLHRRVLDEHRAHAGHGARRTRRPFNSAADLDGDNTRRNNAVAAGRAANFFVVNPHANAVNVVDSGAYSDYHALQIEVRQRLSRGMAFNANYQYAREGGSAFLGFHYGRAIDPTDNVRHAIKWQWDWSIPVGQGRRYGTDMNPVLDGIVGGWEFTGAGTGAGADGRLRQRAHGRNDDGRAPGDVQVPDHSRSGQRQSGDRDDAAGRSHSEHAAGVQHQSDVRDRLLGARRARGQVLRAGEQRRLRRSSRPGDCAARTLLIRAPFFTRVDIGLTKRFPLQGRMNLEFRMDVLNLFDNINFNPAANPGGGATIFQVGSAYRDPDNNFDPGGRLGQLSIRFNW